MISFALFGKRDALTQENKVIIRQLDSDAQNYLNLYPKGYGWNVLRVTSLSGATVTVNYGDIVVGSYTYKENETVHNFDLNSDYGTYTVTATKTNHLQETKSFENTFAGLHEITVEPIYNVLTVTSIEGATVTVTKDTTLTYTYQTGETVHNFSLKDGIGIYNVTASKMGYITQSKMVQLESIGIHSVSIELTLASSTLETSSWNKIKEISNAGTGPTMWSIGDKKSVIVNGTINGYSYNTTLYVFITDFAHNVSVEGTGICFQGFKDEQGKDVTICAPNYNGTGSGFVINQEIITTGGWNGSYMKQTIIPQFKNALPTDLVSNIKTTTIWTHNVNGGSDNDYAFNVTSTQETIYLLAEFEIYGKRGWANNYEQQHQTQYQYYKNGNSSIKYNYTSTASAVNWWTRSAECVRNQDWSFVQVSTNGSVSYNYTYYSIGFSPVFKI